MIAYLHSDLIDVSRHFGQGGLSELLLHGGDNHNAGGVMAVTAIRSIRNSSESEPYFARNHENQNDTGGPGKSLEINSGEVVQCNMWVPWCATQEDFDNRHKISIVPLAFNEIPVTFTIGQQGDYVRYSKDGLFHDEGEPVPGNNTVGGDRAIQIVGTSLTNADIIFY